MPNPIFSKKIKFFLGFSKKLVTAFKARSYKLKLIINTAQLKPGIILAIPMIIPFIISFIFIFNYMLISIFFYEIDIYLLNNFIYIIKIKLVAYKIMEDMMKDFYRQNVIDFALIHLDKPYVWDTAGPDTFDCSGFTFYIFKELFDVDINESGYGIGDTTKQMSNEIGNLKKYHEDDLHKIKYIEEIGIGDLIFFHTQSIEENHPTPTNRYPGHVGIYLGENKFIHASSKLGK